MTTEQAAVVLLVLTFLCIVRGLKYRKKRGKRRVYIANSRNDD